MNDRGTDKNHAHDAPGGGPPVVTRDPVCGMTVKPDGPHRMEYKGKTYLFCCPHCLAKFQNDPDSYIESAAQDAAA
ncbi:MAG: YHS domain-containing protein, partial [bacterium]